MSATFFDQPPLLYTESIRINSRTYRNKPAAICDGEVLSWGEFNPRINQVANALLGIGLQKNDKVALVMSSSIAMFELIWGTIKAGGVIVPLNVMMAGESLAAMVNNCEARFLIADKKNIGQVDAVRHDFVRIERYFATGYAGAHWESAEALVNAGSREEPPVRIEMSDSMNIIYSSGSTGVPKGIEHSHLSRHLYSLGYGPGMQINRHSSVICSTPLYTNGTWITMLPAVYWGGTTVLMTKYSAKDFLEHVQKYRCTHMFAVPTQFIVLLESGLTGQYDTSSMRVFLSGGQAIATRTWEDMEAAFPSARMYQTYGCTEGFCFLCTPEDYDNLGKQGSVGLPIFNGEILILGHNDEVLPPGEVGEVVAYGPNLMKGYYNSPKLSEAACWVAPDGRTWLRSGDLGRTDEDGYLWIVGRVKDMIKSGGINVFASDIEEIFMRHPQVAEAAAIGIPHDKWVETPILLAIMREGATISPEELREWGNNQLGKWQRVSLVEYRDEFPRGTHDKVLKRELRDPYWPKK